MHTCIYFTYISDTNNSNQYTYTYMHISNSIHNRSQSHLSSYFTFVLSFQRYTQSHTHSCDHLYILIHLLIHVFIHVYSFIHSFITSFTYTHSRILLSFVIIFWLYVIMIIYHLTTLCVHDIFPLMFTIMFQIVSFSFSIIIFMFHEHIFTFFIFYIFPVSCLLHMELHILVKYDVCGITSHSYILIPL